MKKNIESIYNEEKAIRFAYECDTEQDGAKEEAKKRMAALWDAVEAEGEDFAAAYRLYREAKDNGNDCIDISDVVWDGKVAGLVRSFRECGIEKFTFSSSWSDAVKTAWLFLQNGCQLAGMAEVKGSCTDFRTGERETRPAYIFTVG